MVNLMAVDHLKSPIAPVYDERTAPKAKVFSTNLLSENELVDVAREH